MIKCEAIAISQYNKKGVLGFVSRYPIKNLAKRNNEINENVLNKLNQWVYYEKGIFTLNSQVKLLDYTSRIFLKHASQIEPEIFYLNLNGDELKIFFDKEEKNGIYFFSKICKINNVQILFNNFERKLFLGLKLENCIKLFSSRLIIVCFSTNKEKTEFFKKIIMIEQNCLPKIKIIPFNQIAIKGNSESSIIYQEKFNFICSHGSQKTLNDHSIIFFINEIKIFYHFNETSEENNKNVFSEMFFDEILDENENENNCCSNIKAVDLNGSFGLSIKQTSNTFEWLLFTKSKQKRDSFLNCLIDQVKSFIIKKSLKNMSIEKIREKDSIFFSLIQF